MLETFAKELLEEDLTQVRIIRLIVGPVRSDVIEISREYLW